MFIGHVNEIGLHNITTRTSRYMGTLRPMMIVELSFPASGQFSTGCSKENALGEVHPQNTKEHFQKHHIAMYTKYSVPSIRYVGTKF